MIDCASTCPPYTRPSGMGWDTPVKMSSVVRASEAARSSTVSRAATESACAAASEDASRSTIALLVVTAPVARAAR
jgi:hypothetical protein